jgi:hypothetical protein
MENDSYGEFTRRHALAIVKLQLENPKCILLLFLLDFGRLSK